MIITARRISYLINQDSREPSVWKAPEVSPNPPEVRYDSVMSDGDLRGMAELTAKIVSAGNVP